MQLTDKARYLTCMEVLYVYTHLLLTHNIPVADLGPSPPDHVIEYKEVIVLQ